RATTMSNAVAGPEEEGLACGEGQVQVLDTLGVPRDPRGIVLLCGYVASAAFGFVALLSPTSDPIGFAYLAVAVVGYLFIQNRGLTTFPWLFVAAGCARLQAVADCDQEHRTVAAHRRRARRHSPTQRAAQIGVPLLVLGGTSSPWRRPRGR